MAPPYPATALAWRSASATRRSASREVNQDAFHDAPQAGLFVVADGMGGHMAGDFASRSIVEVLETSVMREGDLDARVAQIEMALTSVNRALRETAAKRGPRVVIGSTVAALVLGGRHAVCLWAGDSRIYLLRGDHLYQLTEDHSASEAHAPGAPANTITRAVGSADDLELDRVVVDIEAADRLLVCSDGLTKVVGSPDLATMLAGPIDHLPERLIAQAVMKGTRDNVTVIVVEVGSADEPFPGEPS